MHETFGNRGFHGDDRVVIDHGDLAGLVDLFGLFPVDDVQIVGVVLRAAGLEGRTAQLDPANVTLGTEGVGERPAIRHEFTRVRQILAVGRQFDREGVLGLDAAFFAVELPVGDGPAEFLVELRQRRIATAQNARILRGLDHIFRVRRDKGAAVFGLQDRVHDDLLRFEVVQRDHAHARRGFIVDEQVFAVQITVGFGDGRVVGIPPVQLAPVDLALFENRFQFFVEAIALPRLGGEDGDIFQNPH